MKKILLLLVLVALGGAGYYFLKHVSRASGFVPDAGYTALYDGKSLQGWRAVGGQSTFAADGEDIVGRHGPGDNTFLRTDKTYADFSLKLQMRWDEPGNSGVMFRAQQRDGDGRVYGYQYELDDDAGRSWSAGIYDEARRGWFTDFTDKPEVRAAIRRNDWNDVEIEARGTRLKTWINGVAAAEVFDGLDAEGFIALQVHSGDKGVMRWRHIQIKALPPLSQAGESLLQSNAWPAEGLDLKFDANGFSPWLPVRDIWLTPRRRFSDALVRMTVQACDSPTVIQMRYQTSEQGDSSSFAEVKIYADRAEARLQTPTGERVLKPVSLQHAAQHRFVGITSGGAVTFTVDEVDALRLANTGLPERGQLRIQPAHCGELFRINDVDWFSLQEKPAAPQFYQTLDTQPAPVLSPEEALSAFRIAPGFAIELVASEPLIGEPVAMAWDEYGRLYVVEMRGYMRDAYGTDSDAPVGRVVRLEDTDGDGRMDTSEVFLDQLVSPRAVAVVNEGVLIGEPPNLWLCALPTRNARCEHRQRVGAYADDASAANVEHMENGLRQGLDNWLYNAKSARSLKLQDGKLVERNGLNRGQWGISQDDYGRLFYNHNSTWLQADFFAAEDLLQPGEEIYPAGLGVNLTDPAEVFSVRVNPGVNRAYLDNTLRADGRLLHATGVSGLAVYRGDQFPAEYRGNVFVPEVAANVVAQFALSESGIALSAEHRLYEDARWGQREFLGSTDERFRPVDALNGPDGALYIIDMYHGIVQDDHFLTDELREQIFQRQLETPIGLGRIWRVRHTQGKPARDIPALATANDAQLIAALGEANGWVRDTAQRLLLARKGNLAPELAKVATGDNTIAALHAIWTLQGRDELRRELVLQLARSGDLQRQVQALRAGAGLMQTADLLALQQELRQPPAALAMQLALAMSGHAEHPGVRTALAGLLTAHLDNPYVRQAVVHAVAGQEIPFLQEVLAAGGFAVRSASRDATLQALAAGAYRSLRGDLTSTAPANAALLELLALAGARTGELAWQQQAMLQGMESVSTATGFVPAQLAAPPPIFTDRSIHEGDALWNARLAARAVFTWPGDELAAGLQPLSAQQAELVALGEKFYPQCAACHGDSGAGIDGLAPPLAGAPWVTGPPEWLARIILQGMHGPVTVRDKSFDGVMPAHGQLAALDDATLAGLMTYLRRSWGNKADPVSAETAAAIRAASAGRTTPWTSAELEAVPYDRGFKRFEGDYTVSFLTLTVAEKPDGLYISAPMYGGGMLQAVNATTFRIDVGGETVKVEFVVEPSGAVNSLLLYRKGEKIPVQRKSR
jgi:glucose/arabinose dehydrogenase/mono/diheme cytochrome c family protein